MDIKNKVENAYNSDSIGRKKRVMVALSGGIDSYVCAYLLKIQKYDLVGVTVATGWESYAGEQNSILSCYLSSETLSSIKEFCYQLNIPHQTIKATGEFQEEVVEGWIANKIIGTKPNPCWNCHDLRMNLLYQKMVQLGIDSMATGHFAKVFHQEAHGSTYVHTSNDEVFDQSILLSRLPNKILQSLILPLSDLQKKEVLKLAENFGLELINKKLKFQECFPKSDELHKFLETRIPAKYCAGGDIVSEDGTQTYGEHQGIIHYNYAETFQLNSQRKVDLYFTKYSAQEKRLILQDESYFKREKAFLVECKISEETPWLEPMKGVIRLSTDNYVDCWIYPKNFKSALVKWEGAHKIIEGDIVPVYRKRGKNAKVYLTGKLRFLPQDLKVEDGEKNASDNTTTVTKVDHSRDF